MTYNNLEKIMASHQKKQQKKKKTKERETRQQTLKRRAKLRAEAKEKRQTALLEKTAHESVHGKLRPVVTNPAKKAELEQQEKDVIQARLEHNLKILEELEKTHEKAKTEDDLQVQAVEALQEKGLLQDVEIVEQEDEEEESKD